MLMSLTNGRTYDVLQNMFQLHSGHLCEVFNRTLELFDASELGNLAKCEFLLPNQSQRAQYKQVCVKALHDAVEFTYYISINCLVQAFHVKSELKTTSTTGHSFDNVVGIIDGTTWGICRPGDDAEQRS